MRQQSVAWYHRHVSAYSLTSRAISIYPLTVYPGMFLKAGRKPENPEETVTGAVRAYMADAFIQSDLAFGTRHKS